MMTRDEILDALLTAIRHVDPRGAVCAHPVPCKQRFGAVRALARAAWLLVHGEEPSAEGEFCRLLYEAMDMLKTDNPRTRRPPSYHIIEELVNRVCMPPLTPGDIRVASELAATGTIELTLSDILEA